LREIFAEYKYRVGVVERKWVWRKVVSRSVLRVRGQRSWEREVMPRRQSGARIL